MEPTILDRLLAISSLLQTDSQRIFAGTQLTGVRVHALRVLHHAGPSTQQQLSAVLGTTPRSVSALVDGLEAAGYVERGPHPSDRRAVIVSLTDEAQQRMQQVQDEHQRLSAHLVDAIEDADRQAFERGVDAVFWYLNDHVRGDRREHSRS